MGRRRTTGETRSAGAGRACKHPLKVLEYQAGHGGATRVRCRRCGAELLPLEPPPARRRDKPWRPRR
jgi:hypothetical protein